MTARSPDLEHLDRDGSDEANVASSSSSDSSSTDESERLRRLFAMSDRDQDGFIDEADILFMCRQLNMEEAAQELMTQLGTDENGRISFEEFARCRSRVMGEQRMHEPKATSWLTSSESNIAMQELDYDSGAQDISPEPTSLQALLERHNPQALQRMVAIEEHTSGAQSSGGNFLEVANTLHLAALTSLKGEIIELSNRLQHVTSEKELLEKQLAKTQTEKLRLQRECEDRLEQHTARYEERLTELHVVIAELRKKLDRHQINVIREEDEEEDSNEACSAKGSEDAASANENNANDSQVASVDIGNDLNAELSRVVSELETAIGERRKMAVDSQSDAADPAATDNESIEEKTMQVVKEMEDFHFSPKIPPLPTLSHLDVSEYEDQITQLRLENAAITEQLGRQEADLNKVKVQVGSIREERDRLKRRVRELQTRLQSIEAATSPHNSRTSTPTKSPMINPSTGERSIASSESSRPVPKIAELKKLRTSGSDRQVLGAELSSYGLPNAKVAEHLVQSLQECSNVQEIFQTVYQCGNEISENKVREFEIELERLTSKIDSLKSQNDWLTLTLEESKAHSDRLSVLMGKYESNTTALQLSINYSDHMLEAYEVLLALVESEQGVLLANCRAAGLGSLVVDSMEPDNHEEVRNILQRAQCARKASENVAKQLLQRLDRSCGVAVPGCTSSPWEDLSSNSRTASTTSSTASSADTDFSKLDQQRLRDYLLQLKNDRAAVRLTVMELESIHIDPLAKDMTTNPDAQRLDLENAVLMQELMAMKEEKAELKAQNYLMEKEKRALELRLSGKESQEQAYLVQIEHLKCEVKEQQRLCRDPRYRKSMEDDNDSCSDKTTPAITLAELRTSNESEIAQNLSDSLKREKKLKARVQELMATLEKITKNSEVRHQQSAEVVNDLKRVNSDLITAFDKVKKKYQSKLKKLEMQIQVMAERHDTQVRMLKQRIGLLEEENSRPPTSETSL